MMVAWGNINEHTFYWTNKKLRIKPHNSLAKADEAMESGAADKGNFEKGVKLVHIR